jgi:LmbE family N-acetylglucosaminyl deacetylase
MDKRSSKSRVAMTAGEILTAAHSLPFRPLREVLEARPFIVIAPHPDDESLACGGLIAEACRQAIRGKVVIVSDGAGSHPNSKELRMQLGLRRICCLLSVLALVGLVGCASLEPRDFAYETTYSAVGAQVK